METTLYVFAGLCVVAGVYAAWRMGFRVYRTYRGHMLVTCPETKGPAGVEVDVGHAAATGLRGNPDLQLRSCTRWPGRQDCDQECLLQIEVSPEDCLVRRMLTEWYHERTCVYCGKPFKEVDSYDHRALFGYDKKPALRSPEGELVAWQNVAVEKLPKVLETHDAVCWNCLIAENFRRQYPERVVDRPWKKPVV